MIKNRTVQLIFQSAFCSLGIIGIIASFGFFEYTFRGDFFVHFTNLSNYLCIGIMFAELIQTAKKREDSYVKVQPVLKFIGMLMILFTFFVFNIMLAPAREAYLNYRIASVLFHVVLPIMYVADWFLFYERGQIRWYHPLMSAVAPIAYVIFVYVRAWILNFDTQVPYLYPYFFLNLDTQGVDGVAKWIAILSVGFIALGYIFFGLDKIKLPNKKSS